MEKTEAAIADKKERERDKRLWQNYRWTSDMYNRLFKRQGGVCAVCGRPPKPGGAPLNVDHKHFHVRARLLGAGGVIPYSGKFPPAIPADAKWCADVLEMPDIFVTGKTKKQAVGRARDLALPRSVRGLLCPGRYTGCNRLMGRIDKIDWLVKVLIYLKNPPAEQILESQNKGDKK
jgi:Recombination endonuclease VII